MWGPAKRHPSSPLVVSRFPVSTHPTPQAHYVHPQVCILVSLYNSIIITWSLSYLGNSFGHPLPWDKCPLVKNSNVTSEEREREGQQSQGRQGHQGARDRE